MARSITILRGDPIPQWARYAVVFCHAHTLAGRPDDDAIQVFSSRVPCERWAMEASTAFPPRAADQTTIWALVYALPAHRTGPDYWGIRLGQCYLAVDPGRDVLKRHEIQAAYGHPAPMPRDTACACCPVGGW